MSNGNDIPPSDGSNDTSIARVADLTAVDPADVSLDENKVHLSEESKNEVDSV